MTENTPRCAHCGGSLVKEEDGRKCLSCSRVWRTNTEIHAFYEDHRHEILKTFRKLGREGTSKAWQMTLTTLKQLLNRWGIVEQPLVTELPTTGPESEYPVSTEELATPVPAANNRSPDIVATLQIRITDVDLASLDLVDFNFVWDGLGKMVRRRVVRLEIYSD